MAQTSVDSRTYFCPMHAQIHRAGPGKCPKCGMDLLPEGTRFGLLRHMFGSPRHIVVMGAIMVAVMIAAMVIMH